MEPSSPAFPTHNTEGMSVRLFIAAQFAAVMAANPDVGRWLQRDPIFKNQEDGLPNFSTVVAYNVLEFADELLRLNNLGPIAFKNIRKKSMETPHE
jgi:hypothetical protein